MHWKKARAEGLTDKAMGKRKRPEACSIGESHTYPRSSAGGSKERVVQERNWGDEPGDPPPRCGSRRCPCPQLPQPHSALETFPPMLSRLEHRLLEIRNLGFDWGTISQSKGHRGKPLHTFLLGTVEAWKGHALWNQANLVSNPDSSTCYLYRFGQIT